MAVVVDIARRRELACLAENLAERAVVDCVVEFVKLMSHNLVVAEIQIGLLE